MSKPQYTQRHDGRVAALQYLYAWSINPPDNPVDDLRIFFEGLEHPRDHYSFGEELIDGVIKNREAIDAQIRSMAQNWEFERIAKIDLAILRIAMYEMLHRKDIPPVVSINEAIEIAKKFSTAESGAFVNGLLDKVKKDVLRPARQASNLD